MKCVSKKLIASVAFLSTALACGDAEFQITREEGAENEQALLDGIRTQARPEIGQMSMQYPSDGNWYTCTVTLVEANVIVTARHCLDWSTCESDACLTPNDVTFQDASGRDHVYRIDRFVSFDRSGRVAQGSGRRQIDISENRPGHGLSFDVAVARLSTSVPASVATPTPMLRAHPANGTRVTAWGFGCQNRETLTGGNFKQLRDFVMGQSSDRLCPGDSGGPMTQGRDGGVVYVNSGYLPGQDIFGDLVRFRAQIDTVLAEWNTGSTPPQPQPPSNGGGCEYVCESQNTRVKYCGGVEVERKTVCGATQECVSLSPTRTTCEDTSAGGGGGATTPSGCYYQCVGERTRVHYCDGAEIGRQEICGPSQACVNTSQTTVTCQNR